MLFKVSQQISSDVTDRLLDQCATSHLLIGRYWIGASTVTILLKARKTSAALLMTDPHYLSCYKNSKKSWPWSRWGCLTFAGEVDVTDIPVCFGGGGEAGLGGWCERSCGGMRQRGYQFVEGFLCPISSVKGHVPRVLTLVTSLASSLPGDLGPGVFITNPLHCPTTASPLQLPNTALPMEENKTPPSLSSASVHVLIGCISIHWSMTTHLWIFALC